MALRLSQSLIEMSIKNHARAKGRPARKVDNLTANLWADCLGNVGSFTSHNPIGFDVLSGIALPSPYVCVCVCGLFNGAASSLE
jgi:hypothetical protein